MSTAGWKYVSHWPICLYWWWYWGGNAVSRPAPVKQAAFLASSLYPAIISIICSVRAPSHYLCAEDIDSIDNTVLCLIVSIWLASMLLTGQNWSRGGNDMQKKRSEAGLKIHSISITMQREEIIGDVNWNYISLIRHLLCPIFTGD